jgi:hypothetical protein
VGLAIFVVAAAVYLGFAYYAPSTAGFWLAVVTIVGAGVVVVVVNKYSA